LKIKYFTFLKFKPIDELKGTAYLISLATKPADHLQWLWVSGGLFIATRQ